jgi:SAM-dependent methyltransferase
MHPTAMSNAELFFKNYAESFCNKGRVIDIGSQDVNGSIRDVCPSGFDYIGVDFCEAKGVDVVLSDPYSLPFGDEYADIIVSSSCFEHAEFFWLVFMEAMRCLKPAGLLYLNAPSTGGFHRYPVDCWRFYPDSGQAMVNWAKRNGVNAALLESYTQIGGRYSDFVAVFLKDAAFADNYRARILDTKKDYENGRLYGQSGILNFSDMTQEEKKLGAINKIICGEILIR